MNDFEKIDQFIKSYGGLEEVYRASQAYFDFSKFLKEGHADRKQALPHLIRVGRIMMDQMVLKREFAIAAGFREILGEMIDELGKELALN